MATNTLMTKVMLGVFGSVPAFDTFFVRGFRGETGRGLSFGRNALVAVDDFYQRHRVAIDAVTVFTLDAATGQPTDCSALHESQDHRHGASHRRRRSVRRESTRGTV